MWPGPSSALRAPSPRFRGAKGLDTHSPRAPLAPRSGERVPKAGEGLMPCEVGDHLSAEFGEGRARGLGCSIDAIGVEIAEMNRAHVSQPVLCIDNEGNEVS